MEKFLKVLSKFTSRKFLAVLGAQLGAVVALFSTSVTGEKVTDAVLKIGALIALVVTAIAYGLIEASVDKAALPDAGRKKAPGPAKTGPPTESAETWPGGPR